MKKQERPGLSKERNMAFKITRKEILNQDTILFEIHSPLIADKARAGQFVILRINENGERVPFTVVKNDSKKGIIQIIFKIVGATTKELSMLETGDTILDIAGPLGNPSNFGYVGRIVFVGGGVGTAELVPVLRYAREMKNFITTIIGAKDKESVILEQEIQLLSDVAYVTTDDGSYGRKGLVTDVLKELLEKERFDMCYTVGPDIMMKNVCELTRRFDLKTVVSLDANMVDATGMCGTCRVKIGKETKFTCVDGPEFDGHLIDWDEFLLRQKRFQEEEKFLYGLSHRKCQK